jgi:mediator of RNA polymerase II transcription subunit 13
MEFLRTCNTNAQAIVRASSPFIRRYAPANSSQGDFEAVAFQAFSVARNPARPSSRTLEWNVSDDIRVAEAELRRGNHIVLQDASRPWLWLFRATTADQVGQPPLELPTVDDFLFNSESCPRSYICAANSFKGNNMAS